MAKIALFGGSGAMGKTVASALKGEGTSYRVVGRSLSSLQQAFGGDPLAELKTWNPDDPQSIRQAAQGIETIVYLVGVNYWQFELHPVLMQKTIEGAVAEGVRRIFLIGTVYPYGIPQSPTVNEDHPRAPHTFKGRMRKEQEDLLFAAHESGKLQASELRLPDFYGPNVDKSFLWSAFVAAKKGGRAQLIAPIDTPHQFVYVPDVGGVVARLISNEGTWGRVWHFAGSGTITQRAFAEKIFAAAGCPPKILVANKLVLRALGLFNPLLRELVEMHYLLTSPVILEDTRLSALLGGLRKTSYEEGIRATLASMPSA
jgi:nucleoside-diphosphate-sugar epimerase